VIAPSRYRLHPGETHDWSLAIPHLAGARPCRTCGQLAPGGPFIPASGDQLTQRERDRLAQVVAEPYRACPRFDTCSVNRCPLDPEIGARTFNAGDRETKCPLSKRVRHALFAELPTGAQARLPFGGLLEVEWKRSNAARRRLAALTAEQRARLAAGRQRGMAAIRKARLSRPVRPSTPEGSESPSDPLSPAKAHSNGGETA